MCIQEVRKVIKICDDRAILDDGRSVRIAMVKDVKIGDSLEVYGDIALAKIDSGDHKYTYVHMNKKRSTT